MGAGAPRGRVVTDLAAFRITVAPVGLLIVPLRITSDGPSLRICTRVGAVVRSRLKVSETFGPFKST